MKIRDNRDGTASFFFEDFGNYYEATFQISNVVLVGLYRLTQTQPHKEWSQVSVQELSVPTQIKLNQLLREIKRTK